MTGYDHVRRTVGIWVWTMSIALGSKAYMYDLAWELQDWAKGMNERRLNG